MAWGKLASFATVSPYPPEQPSLFLSANRHRIGRTTMITTVPRTPTLGSPRRPALDRPAAMTLAETAYQRFLAQLRDLSDDDWSRPTDCPDWDVRAVASHVLAQAEMAASVREGVRQARAARRRGGVLIDALTALQVAEHSGLSPAELVERFAATAPKAARAWRRAPWLLRRLPMPDKPVVNGHAEAWSLGYAVDVVLTRDTWMHGIDISLATGWAARLTRSTTACWSPTSSPSGPSDTPNRAGSTSPARRAAPGRSARAGRRSNSTRSSSAGSSPAAGAAPAS